MAVSILPTRDLIKLVSFSQRISHPNHTQMARALLAAGVEKLPNSESIDYHLDRGNIGLYPGIRGMIERTYVAALEQAKMVSREVEQSDHGSYQLNLFG